MKGARVSLAPRSCVNVKPTKSWGSNILRVNSSNSDVVSPMLRKRAVWCVTFMLLFIPVVQAQSQALGRTVLDGVFSEEQAKRGQAAYTTHCNGCHGDALEGVSAPQLTGNHFLERWREDMLDAIYNFIRE